MNHWWLETRGLRLRVWELGDGRPGGVPVVCLHAWLDQGMEWAAVAEGRRGRWVAPDQRGFGGSDPVGPGGYYHFMDLLPDLDALVRHLGGRVDLVGHSMGGTAATCYAGARPDAVRRLAAIEGLGALAGSPRSQLQRVRAHLDGLRSPPGAPRLRSVDDAATRLLHRHPGLGEDHARLLAEHGTQPDGDRVRWAFDPLHMVPGPYPFREDQYLEFLGQITAPTLVVWGSESWFDAETQQRRASAIADVRVEVLSGGHMLPYEQPQRLGALLDEHLGH